MVGTRVVSSTMGMKLHWLRIRVTFLTTVYYLCVIVCDHRARISVERVNYLHMHWVCWMLAGRKNNKTWYVYTTSCLSYLLKKIV